MLSSKIADPKKRREYIKHVIIRQNPLFYRIYKKRTKKDIKIVGMIRERNESLLLKDTLDHLSQFVDAIVVFDDASTDDSVAIARDHPSVVEVIVNKSWKKKNRVWEETANRKKLHDRAKAYNPEWLFYADADERFEGDIRNFLLNDCPQEVSGVKISLFDAYITKEDKKPYRKGQQLYDFRKYFGPERRDILMIWRNDPRVEFLVPDARQPQGLPDKQKIVKFYCQHYGKSLSIDHWEDTCRYYIDFFPKYSEKWLSRLGKAVHESSDFDRPLDLWENVKIDSVLI